MDSDYLKAFRVMLQGKYPAFQTDAMRWPWRYGITAEPEEERDTWVRDGSLLMAAFSRPAPAGQPNMWLGIIFDDALGLIYQVEQRSPDVPVSRTEMMRILVQALETYHSPEKFTFANGKCERLEEKNA